MKKFLRNLFSTTTEIERFHARRYQQLEGITIEHLNRQIDMMNPVYEWFLHMIRCEATKFRCLHGRNPTTVIIKYPIHSEQKGNMIVLMTDCGELRFEVDPQASDLIKLK